MISDDFFDNSRTCRCLTKSKDFFVSNQDDKVKIDLTLDKYNKDNYVKIWGNLYHKNKKPLCGVFVFLYKYTNTKKNLIFCKKTCTDERGMYEFTLPYTIKGKYVVKVQRNIDQLQVKNQHDDFFCKKNSYLTKKNNIFYY